MRILIRKNPTVFVKYSWHFDKYENLVKKGSEILHQWPKPWPPRTLKEFWQEKPNGFIILQEFCNWSMKLKNKMKEIVVQISLFLVPFNFSDQLQNSWRIMKPSGFSCQNSSRVLGAYGFGHWYNISLPFFHKIFILVEMSLIF